MAWPIGDLDARHRLLSQTIYNDSRYLPVCRDYCRGIAHWFQTDLRRLLLFGDLGREMTVVTAYAKQRDTGVTLARLVSTVNAFHFASVRRVRSICVHLEHLGVVRTGDAPHDGRERPLRFGGGWLDQALTEWLLISFRALAHWMDALPECSLAAVARWCRFTVEALEKSGKHPVLSWPEYRAVRDHMAGYPVIVELVSRATEPTQPPLILVVSRKALARAYGVSRIHVATLINLFEQMGWLFRPSGDPGLAFVPERLARLRFQFASELAWVGLAFVGSQGRPPEDLDD